MESQRASLGGVRCIIPHMTALHISTAFDSGSIEVLALDDPRDIRLNIRRDSARSSHSGFTSACKALPEWRWF